MIQQSVSRLQCRLHCDSSRILRLPLSPITRPLTCLLCQTSALAYFFSNTLGRFHQFYRDPPYSRPSILRSNVAYPSFLRASVHSLRTWVPCAKHRAHENVKPLRHQSRPYGWTVSLSEFELASMSEEPHVAFGAGRGRALCGPSRFLRSSSMSSNKGCGRNDP